MRDGGEHAALAHVDHGVPALRLLLVLHRQHRARVVTWGLARFTKQTNKKANKPPATADWGRELVTPPEENCSARDR